jgi:hypothetical protein
VQVTGKGEESSVVVSAFAQASREVIHIVELLVAQTPCVGHLTTSVWLQASRLVCGVLCQLL